MAATLLNGQKWLGSYPTGGLLLANVAGDNTNGNVFRPTGNDLLIATGVGTLTINGVPDTQGRDGSLTVTLSSGDVAVWAADSVMGFAGPNGVDITVSANTLKLSVVNLR